MAKNEKEKEKPLFVRMTLSMRENLAAKVFSVAKKIGRPVDEAEYVREALALAAENEASMCKRLR